MHTAGQGQLHPSIRKLRCAALQKIQVNVNLQFRANMYQADGQIKQEAQSQGHAPGDAFRNPRMVVTVAARKRAHPSESIPERFSPIFSLSHGKSNWIIFQQHCQFQVSCLQIFAIAD